MPLKVLNVDKERITLRRIRNVRIFTTVGKQISTNILRNGVICGLIIMEDLSLSKLHNLLPNHIHGQSLWLKSKLILLLLLLNVIIFHCQGIIIV